MKPIKETILITLAALLVGCVATSEKMNQVSLGMTKAEVIKALGKPTTSAGSGDTEFLVYRFYTPIKGEWFVNDRSDYFVRIQNGRVDAYGKKGDFDSTQIEQIGIKLDMDGAAADGDKQPQLGK